MALRKKKHNSRFDRKIKIEHTGFYPYLQQYLESRVVLGFSEETNKRYDSVLRKFITWCDARDMNTPQEITRDVIERYQKHLHYVRKSDGYPLALASQAAFLSVINVFFKWLAQRNHILYDPASAVEMPKRPKRLPRALLSQDSVNSLLNQPNVKTPEGLRDRAILELFYSCGLRRRELMLMRCDDVDSKNASLIVKNGKGDKERYLPIGESAVMWLQTYTERVRDQLTSDMGERLLFLTDYGEGFSPNQLSELVKKYMRSANIEVNGSCHLLRHAMATHMLDNGADIRYIQMMLGHEDLTSTEIYTHVSIERLREVHRTTHPSKVRH